MPIGVVGIVVCSTQLLVHQRMNANGALLPNDLFS
jgi:hypothetical protein